MQKSSGLASGTLYPILLRLESAGWFANVIARQGWAGSPATPAAVYNGRALGYSSIDRAALSLARAGSGHYRPTTDNGLPVKSCFDYLIRFTLRN